MSVLAHTRVPPVHSGVVRFRFYDSEGVVLANRVLTRRDAASVYDGLRKKYPEHEGLRLWTQVVPASEVNRADSRSVVARKVDQQPVVTPVGEPFCSEVDALGPRDSRLSALSALFGGGEWVKARPLEEVLA